MPEGLDKSGGISFGRKQNWDKKEEDKPYGMADGEKEFEEEVAEPRNLDVEQLARQERLGQKLATAKRANGTGLAINSSTIIGCLFYLDSLLNNPATLENLNMVNDMFGLEIDFESIILMVQDYKAQIIGLCISSQTMLMSWKQTRQQMLDDDREDTFGFINDELGKIGI